MNRSELFLKANEVTTKDRAATHGNAEDSFQGIADYWNTYLQHKGLLIQNLKPLDIAVLMTLFKVARSDANPVHEDNWLDLIGYAGIAGEMATKGNIKNIHAAERAMIPVNLLVKSTYNCQHAYGSHIAILADEKQTLITNELAAKIATNPKGEGIQCMYHPSHDCYYAIGEA